MDKHLTTKKPNTVRILYLLKILKDYTDKNNGLTLPEIQEKLAEYGLSSERKSLYRDFDLIEEYGYSLGKISSRPVSYYLKGRLFDETQVMLLVDAVQTSKSITKANSTTLIKKLKELVSENEAKDLDARIHVAGRVKMQNESIFAVLDNISRAIAEKRDISFKYLKYDASKKLCPVEAHDGIERVRTPLYLIYSNDKYYMLAFDEDATDNLRVYRVDRMSGVRIAEKSPKSHKAPAGFDVVDFERSMLGMFAGKAVNIKLEVLEEHVGNIIDALGVDDIECSPIKPAKGQKSDDKKWANVRIKAAANPVFYGYLSQFGADVKVVSPKSVVEGYKQHLKEALDAQQ